MEKFIFYLINFYVGFLICPRLYAQDYAFSQYQHTWHLTNPAFTATYNDSRVQFHYRDQPLGANNDFQTYILSASHAFFKHHPDQIAPQFVLGLSMLHSDQSNFLVSNEAFLNLAYNLPLTSTHQISFGLQGGFMQRKIEPGNSLTASQFTGLGFDPSIPNGESFSSDRMSQAILSSGLLWRWLDKEDKKMQAFAGISLFNINKPDIAFTSGENSSVQLPVNFVLIGGYRLFQDAHISLVPNVRWTHRLGADFVNFGAWLDYHIPSSMKFLEDGKLQVGSWYNTNKAIGFSIGLDMPRYFFTFSYDVPSSSLSADWLGSGAMEITLGLKLPRLANKFTQRVESIADQPLRVARIEPVIPKDSVEKVPINSSNSFNEEEPGYQAKCFEYQPPPISIKLEANQEDFDQESQNYLESVIRNLKDKDYPETQLRLFSYHQEEAQAVLLLSKISEYITNRDISISRIHFEPINLRPNPESKVSFEYYCLGN